VHHRRDDLARADQEDQAPVQRIQTGEQLAPIRVRRVHGPLSAHEHGSIQECIAPWQVLEVRVASHPGQQREHEQGERGREVEQQSPDELAASNGWMWLQPVLPEAGELLLGTKDHRTALPLFQRDLPGLRHVVLEGRSHLASELRAQHDGVDLLVVEEAAPIEICRAYRRPYAVNYGRSSSASVRRGARDLHAILQQLLVVGAPAWNTSAESVWPRQDQSNVDAACHSCFTRPATAGPARSKRS